jgi:nucleoside-diphosphate-sugar epimerase
MSKNNPILVAGAGGFIGGHLVKAFRKDGFCVRAVDRKPFSEWHQLFGDVENLTLDLKNLDACRKATEGVALVYNLAADMGGMGFIELNKGACMLSVLINTHLLIAAKEAAVERFFFSSSACVYNGDRQKDPNVTALREGDAYPALPEDGYGWEKLFSERMSRHFREDYGLVTRTARYHNVYGPNGTYKGGREKAPAAICRKVIEAKLSRKPEIEIWGDGKQTRSFMYITDCVKGSRMLMESDFADPLNIGSSELVSINQLVDIVEEIAGVKLERRYNLSAPKGVNGRNSDNTLTRKVLGWEPSTSLRDGMELTYRWIYDQITANTSPFSKRSGDPRTAPHTDRLRVLSIGKPTYTQLEKHQL